MTVFDVRVIGDDELPPEIDYCFLRYADRLVFVVKASRAASPWVLADSWWVARRLGAGPRLLEAV